MNVLPKEDSIDIGEEIRMFLLMEGPARQSNKKNYFRFNIIYGLLF